MVRLRFAHSLRGRLLVMLMTLSALPAMLIGGLAYRNGRQTIERRIDAQLTTIADLKKEQLTVWLRDRRADARLLGMNYLNEEHFSVILNPAADPARRKAFAGFLTDNLLSLRQTRAGYSEILFVDTSGRVVLSTERSRIGANIAAERGVRATLASPTGEHIEDIHLSARGGTYEMLFGHILRAVDPASGAVLRKVKGAVIIRVGMAETVFRLLDSWPAGARTGESLLVRAEAGDVVFLNPLRFSDAAPLTLRVAARGRVAGSSQLAIRGHEGITRTLDYRGVSTLAAYRTLPETRWGFVTKIDAAEAFDPVAALTRQWLLATLIVLLSAGGVAALLARALSRPLARLVRAAETVTAGEFDADLDIMRRDEIGTLAAAFRAMVAAVRERNEALHARAEELWSLLDLSGRFVGLLAPDNVLKTGLASCAHMIPGDHYAVLLVEDDGQTLTARATRGWPDGPASELRFAFGRQSAAAYAVAHRTPVLVEDISAETRFQVPAVVQRLGANSALAVPMLLGARAVGAFWILSRERRIWEEKAVQLTSLIANQTGLALERARLFQDLSLSYDQTLDALAAALDARDKETEGHSRRVVAYSLALARRMHVSDEDLTSLRQGALLHDIGKIGVPDAILLKPGPLTAAERAIMRRHPEWGARILAGIPFLEAAASIVRAHQEWWNGQGYPEGLAGAAIPIGARIFAVADAFDAITSDRPYRRARSYAEARAEILGGSGVQFDPRVVEVFCDIPQEEWAHLRTAWAGPPGTPSVGAPAIPSLTVDKPSPPVTVLALR